jgi:hypothetical protein
LATGTLNLSIGAANLPDGSASNAAPGLTRIQGTEASPKKHFLVALFDPATDEHLWFVFRMPANYASAPLVKLLWMANSASSNSVVWGASIGAVTPADADTPVEHASAAASTTTTAGNATEARRLIETSITLSNTDSVAAGDLVFLLVYRDANNGSDTLAVDAELISAALEYTTT